MKTFTLYECSCICTIYAHHFLVFRAVNSPLQTVSASGDSSNASAKRRFSGSRGGSGGKVAHSIP